MQIVKTAKRMHIVSAGARAKGRRIGFVPTMGALHAGHAALMKRCREENDLCVLSIFVNPLQFGPDEDFAAYPRDKKKDVLLAKKENVDIILYPSAEEMYPAGSLTTIDVREITEPLCGRARPGHFRGVATVVAKLLNIVTPHVLYLGQKDAQQCAVIRQMVRDLNFPVQVAVVPTVREADGLAMSSRNRYLSLDQRRQAAFLFRALTTAQARIRQGEHRAARIEQLIRGVIREHTSGRIDYIACVDADTLKPRRIVAKKTLIALAVRIGRARLIDNILV